MVFLEHARPLPSYDTSLLLPSLPPESALWVTALWALPSGLERPNAARSCRLACGRRSPGHFKT